MNRSPSNIIIVLLIVLGGIGFLSTLVFNPGAIIMQIGLIALFVGIFYLLYRMYLRRRLGGSEYSAYLRAAKRSKKRYNDQPQRRTQLFGVGGGSKKSVVTVKRSSGTSSQKKKSTTHLTVIEGKKGKKKNRAFF